MKFFELYDFAESKRLFLIERAELRIDPATASSNPVAAILSIREWIGKDILKSNGYQVIHNSVKLALYAGQGGQHVAKRDIENTMVGIPAMAILCGFFQQANFKADNRFGNNASTIVETLLISDEEQLNRFIQKEESKICTLVFIQKFTTWYNGTGKPLVDAFIKDGDNYETFLKNHKNIIPYKLLQKLSEKDLQPINIQILQDHTPIKAIATAIALGMNDSDNPNPVATYRTMLATLIQSAKQRQLLFVNGVDVEGQKLDTANVGKITVPWFANIMQNINSDDPTYKSKISTLQELSNTLVNLSVYIYDSWTIYIKEFISNPVAPTTESRKLNNKTRFLVEEEAPTEPESKNDTIEDIWQSTASRGEVCGLIYIDIIRGELNIDLDENGIIYSRLNGAVQSKINERRSMETRVDVVKTLRDLGKLCVKMNDGQVTDMYRAILRNLENLSAEPAEVSYMNVAQGVANSLNKMAGALKGV